MTGQIVAITSTTIGIVVVFHHNALTASTFADADFRRGATLFQAYCAGGHANGLHFMAGKKL